jgi:hypothetical protein
VIIIIVIKAITTMYSYEKEKDGVDRLGFRGYADVGGLYCH